MAKHQRHTEPHSREPATAVYQEPAASRSSAQRHPNALFAIAIVLVFLAVLGVGFAYQPLIEKLARRTLFFATWHDAWLAFTAPRPGEFLDYLARGLTTLGMRPMLCIAVLALASAGLTALWGGAFRKSRAAMGFAAFPVLLFLCQLAHLGFSVYLFKQTSFLFCHLLGFAAALALYWLWQRWRGALLLAAALYPLLGMPAIFACIFIAIHALGERRWGTAALAAALSAAAPGLCAEFLYGAYALDSAYTVNAIILFESEALWWNIAAGAALFAAALCALFNALRLTLPLWCSLPALLLPFFITTPFAWFIAEKDTANLFAILRAENAAEHGDWEALLAIPTPPGREPHRMLTAYRILAMFRTGTLADRLLTYPVQTKHTTTSIDTMKIDGFRLLYRYGLVQIARKWCWEKTEDLSPTPDSLLYFGRIALITGELDAAKTWFTLLARCPFYATEAAEGLRLATDPTAEINDPELGIIHDLFVRLSADSANPVFENQRNLEAIIYSRYAVMKRGSQPMVGLHLIANMLMDNPLPVLENLETLLALRPDPTTPLPRYYQEAILTALAEIPTPQQPRIPTEALSQASLDRFQRFQHDARRIFGPGAAPTPEARDAFATTYRDTYYFYKGFQP